MKFQSKYTGYVFVVRPTNTVLIEGQIIKQKGKTVTFDETDGIFETEDKSVITALKENQFFNTDYFVVDEKKKDVLPQEDEKAPAKDASCVKSYNEFRDEYYKGEKTSVKGCSEAWNKYKKENNIK